MTVVIKLLADENTILTVSHSSRRHCTVCPYWMRAPAVHADINWWLVMLINGAALRLNSVGDGANEWKWRRLVSTG